MKRRLLSFNKCFFTINSILLLITLQNSYSQREANVWYFGTRAGLNFNNIVAGNPQTLSNGALDAAGFEGEGYASVSDADGNLLFYTDGVTLYNRNHAVMGNGTGLMGQLSSAQSAVAVPMPGNNPGKYYVFTVPAEELSTGTTGSRNPLDGLRYNMIDMSLNAGLGGVVTTAKNIQLSPATIPIAEGLTVVPHFDGSSFWVITHRGANRTDGTTAFNDFYAYRIGTDNINTTTGVITLAAADRVTSNAGVGFAGVPAGPSSNTQLIIKANNCFTKLAMSYFAKQKLVEIYNFNNSTGAISLANSITNFDAADANEVYGLEFSSNDNFLYTTVLGSKALYQFNISSGVNATINAAGSRNKWTISDADVARLGQLQMGPDGKIYASCHYWNVSNGTTQRFLGVVNNPNTAGAGANFVYNQISFQTSGVGTKHGLPQFYKGFLAGKTSIKSPSVSNLEEVCVGESIDFDFDYLGTFSNVRWNIDSTLNGGFNSASVDATSKNPLFPSGYATPGLYQVSLSFLDGCNRRISSVSEVRVNPITQPNGTITCEVPNTLRFDVTSPNAGSRYVWYSNSTTQQQWGVGNPFTLSPVTDATLSSVWLFELNNATSTQQTVSPWTAGQLAAEGFPTQSFITVSRPLILESFDVSTYTNNTCAATPTVEIRNSSNAVIFFRTFTSTATCGVINIPLNIYLTPGTYTINFINNSTMLYRNRRGWTNWQNDGLHLINNVFTNTPNAGDAGSTGPAFNFRIRQTGSYCVARRQIDKICTLPVDFAYVKARNTNAQNQIEWATTSETNNAFFEVQHSTDGVNFNSIGRVNGKGTTSFFSVYNFNHLGFSSGINYYRVKQVDFDGTFSFSDVVVVYNQRSGFQITLSPNPNNGQFTLLADGDTNEEIEFSVVDQMGRMVKSGSFTKQTIVNLENNAKGIYTVIVNGKVIKTSVY